MAGEKRASSSPPPEDRSTKAPRQDTGGWPLVLYLCGSCGQEHDAFGDGDIDLCPQCQMSQRQAAAKNPRELYQLPQPAAANPLIGMAHPAGYGLAPPQQQPFTMNPGGFFPAPAPPQLPLGGNAAMPLPFAQAAPYGHMAMGNAAPVKQPRLHKNCTNCNRGYLRSDKNPSLRCTKCCDAALKEGGDPWQEAGEATPEHAQKRLDKWARG